MTKVEKLLYVLVFIRKQTNKLCERKKGLQLRQKIKGVDKRNQTETVKTMIGNANKPRL